MNVISWHEFRQKAARKPQRILLAEGDDLRVIQAARILQTQKIALPWLVGSRKKIAPLWKKEGGQEADLLCIDPEALSSTEKDAFVQDWLRLPKNKQQTRDEALSKISDPLVLGCLTLKQGKVDGFIGGATRTTADTLRAAFQIIGLGPQASTLFGFFLIEPRTGPLVLLADCAVTPEPSPKQLANIAAGSARAYEFFVGARPQVAFLSFSTLGSATHPMVDKVREALKLAQEKYPDIAFEGEWQADTALDAFTATVKGADNLRWLAKQMS